MVIGSLFGVTALDPVTYGTVSALLIAAALLASYIPARRAMAIDPVEALRPQRGGVFAAVKNI